MKNIELFNNLNGTLPNSSNGIFWNDDVLYTLERLPENDIFSGNTYIEILEYFLPKIETDFEDRAEDYAEDLWKLGDASELAKSDVNLSNIINQIEKNGYFHEDDIDKNTIGLRILINAYKKENELSHSPIF